MDTKKIFDMEHKLESLRPELSDAELLDTVSPNAKNVEEIASITVTSGKDGLYLKMANVDGQHTDMVNLNPVVAEALAYELLEGLGSLGVKQEEFAVEKPLNHHKKLH